MSMILLPRRLRAGEIVMIWQMQLITVYTRRLMTRRPLISVSVAMFVYSSSLALLCEESCCANVLAVS
ncbi:hypothetical protein VTK56DRAFT_8532 [Thermocarpiscus australiensis]